MKPTNIFILLIWFVSHAAAQRGNNWVFGGKAWINFSSSPPAMNVSAMGQLEGSASISDLNGNLLFYSEGTKIWNAAHSVMPNGTGLFGSFSSTQSCMIIPFPADSKRYYVFTSDFVGAPNGIAYSVVNMNLNNGMGDVEQKNIPLIAPSSEKITSVNHCNGKDVWVLTAKKGTDAFYAYLVTASGINAPVISSIGEPASYFSIGYLKFSPDGKKIACCNMSKGLDLFDFDASTGVVSNKKTIINGVKQSPYGVEFSPDSKLLYVSNVEEIGSSFFRFDVRQYSNLDAAAGVIALTKTVLTSVDMAAFQGFALYNALQLGPDGQLYVSHMSASYLDVIKKPNIAGVLCNFIPQGLSLANGTGCLYGLPDFNQSYFKNSFEFITSCTSTQVKFEYSRPGDASSVKWDFGDAVSGMNNNSFADSPLHNFTAPGTYNVRLVVYLPCRNDTFTKQVVVDPVFVNLGSDKQLCGVSAVTLQAPANNNYTYLWQDNSILPAYVATQTGLYWVEVTNKITGCIARDSVLLELKPNPLVQLGNDTTICENTVLQLDAANTGASYTWQDNSATQIYKVSKAGRYFVKVNLNGCISADTIDVQIKRIPSVHFGNDTAICNGMVIKLTPQLTDTAGASLLWSTGASGSSILVTQPGNYFLYAGNNCGGVTADILVKSGVCKLYVPSAFTPNDDSRNDVFKPGYGENIASYKMEIYNRWGEKIFNSVNLNLGWNGMYKGIQQPAGTYVWSIRYQLYGDTKEYLIKGVLQLIR